MQEIAFFHGTRDYFLPSIMKDGLGAKSVIANANIPSFLSECFDALGTRFKFDWKGDFEAFPAEIQNIREIYLIVKAAQQSRSGSFNFHHGALYLTDTKSVAQKYAEGMPEIISFGFKLHDLLQSFSMHQEVSAHAFVRAIMPQRGEIESSKPVVISIVKIDSSALFTEHGQPVAAKLCAAVKHGPTSYEYRSVISVNSLSFV